MSNTNDFAHPEVLVDTAWVAEHLDDAAVRFIEVDVDTSAYDGGHLPGAVGWNWTTQTQDPVRRDIPDQAAFQTLMSGSGVDNGMTVVFYGDNNNWFATYAFWLLKMYGHDDVRMVDGGRKKLEAEDRLTTASVPTPAATHYQASALNDATRAYRQNVLDHLDNPAGGLVDVRSPGEFSGELLAPAALPQEGAQRGGHIPGAANIVWSRAVAEDGTFKSFGDLTALYGDNGITADKDIIAYCRIGERSSHTWFVLTYLLGYPKVRNYDGSWTEWGSSIGLPIEKP